MRVIVLRFWGLNWVLRSCFGCQLSNLLDSLVLDYSCTSSCCTSQVILDMRHLITIQIQFIETHHLESSCLSCSPRWSLCSTARSFPSAWVLIADCSSKPVTLLSPLLRFISPQTSVPFIQIIFVLRSWYWGQFDAQQAQWLSCSEELKCC